MKKVFLLLAGFIMLFALTACPGSGGGGGGGGGFTTDYKAVFFAGSEVPSPNEYASNFYAFDVPGTAINNGTSGTMKFKTLESSVGMTDSGSVNISVDSYGFMTISEPGDDPIYGGATPDSSAFFAVDPVQAIGVDEFVTLIVGVKKASGMSNADGDGQYYCSFLEFDGFDMTVNIVDILLDGLGGYTSGTFGDGTYSVSGDGSLTITPDGFGASFKGAARSDGEMFVVHLYSMLGPDAGSLICVKDALGHTAGELQGNYRFGRFSGDNASSPEAESGELFFDGTLGIAVALLTNTSGLSAEPLTFPAGYTVGAPEGYFQIGDGILFVTSDADFLLLVDEPNGTVLVGTRSVPLGFPSDYFAMSIGGDSILNATGSVFSLNAMGGSIAPGESGTLGLKTLMDFSDTYLSETYPFMVDPTGLIELPSATNPAWGFVNTTAKTFFIATTDQTTEDFINLVPGVMAGTGLTNTTATFPTNTIYNCAAMTNDTSYPSFDLEFTGDGELTFASSSFFYGLTDDGLLTVHDGSEFIFGMVNPDTNMVAMILDGFVICLKQPATLSMDGIIGTYMFGTYFADSGSSPDVGAEVGSVSITNSTDIDGELIPTTLYNSTGMVVSPTPQAPVPLFLNTTTNTLELGGDGGFPIWISDDYNLMVTTIDEGAHQQIIFGIRQE